MTHMLPSRFAVVVMPPDVPEPTRGSVRPKHPIFSHRAIGGGPVLFFSFLPPRKEGPPVGALVGPQKALLLEAQRATSLSITPNHNSPPPSPPTPVIVS